MTMEYDIVVVGAGIIGCAASFYLSKAKKKILLIDQFKIDNNLNASHDFSRALRCEYGKDEFYAKMAVKSLRLWKKIEKESGEQLYFNCGFLNISEKRQNYLDEGYEALKKLNQKADFLDEKQLRQKFPQLKGKFAVFDHNGGILDAPLAISSLLSLAKRNGVSVLENCRANKISNNSVLLDNKETIKFKKLVLAAGFWTSKLLKLPIEVTRQQVVYFRPKNPGNFTKAKFPIFIYFDRGFYGFPIHGINAIKISNHLPGKAANPDKDNGKVSRRFIVSCRQFLKKFVPELADAKVVESKICFYDLSPDGDFVIDKMDENIIVGAGFSGHGFKFAPLIGKILTDLVLNGRTKYDISRFRLRRF